MLVGSLLFVLTAGVPAGFAQQTSKLEILDRRVVEPSSFIPPAAPSSLSVPLALVVDVDSDWGAPGRIERMLGKASGIFARCGVGLGETEIIRVRWSPDALRELNDQDPYHPAEIDVTSDPLLPARRPLGMLFGADVPSVAKAYNRTSIDRLVNGGQPDAKRLRDTFWITLDWETHEPPPYQAPSYSVAAHELAHLLGDLDHIDLAPNLMSTSRAPGAQSGDLTDAQCVEIRKLF